MKLNFKLSFIVLIILMFFTIGTVAAGENVTNEFALNQDFDTETLSQIESVPIPETLGLLSASSSNAFYDNEEGVESETQNNGSCDLEIIQFVDNSNPRKDDTVTWTLTVMNNGPDNAKDTYVTDILPKGLKFVSADEDYDVDTGLWAVGDLANNENKTLTVKTVVSLTNTTISNVAVVNSSIPDSNKSNNQVNSTLDIFPEADVMVINIVSNSKPTFGDNITWSVIVVNLGPDTAENVFVSEVLTEGLKFVSFKATKGSYNNGIWNIGTLKDNEYQTLEITTQALKLGTIENVVVADTSTYDSNITNNRGGDVTHPKNTVADLELTKVASKNQFNVGDEIVWTVTVTNYGPDIAVNAHVSDWGYEELKFISAKASKGKFDTENGIWSIGNMDVDETVTLMIACKVLTNRTVVNNAIAISDSYDPNENNNYDNSTVRLKHFSPGNASDSNYTNNSVVFFPESKSVVSFSSSMYPAGNPIVMILFALIAIVCVRLRDF